MTFYPSNKYLIDFCIFIFEKLRDNRIFELAPLPQVANRGNDGEVLPGMLQG